MSEQLSLLAITEKRATARARSTDPETSREAAASANANLLERKVYDYLLSIYPGDRTTKELADEMQLDRVTVSPRMKPLELKRKVERAGRRGRSETWKAIP